MAMLRIADATEAMAKSHVQLQRDYDYMKERCDCWEQLAESRERQTRALKGVVTKMKKNDKD